ncbi:MAG: S1C family serine protease, partial [Gemmataceae bacterium]|nr:S1C family serine protease [Gemmataceae bacterium]
INGRINFEKRFRVNVGVGYAISVNQIKNFLGQFYAGVDTEHASLGASVGSESEDADLAKIVVKQILDESDAFRRGLGDGDQLVTFAGRAMTSANQYKNILGTLPKDWRVPLTFRRDNATREILVRLQSVMPPEREEQRPGQPVPKLEGPPQPKKDSPASKLYKEKKGYANWHFNEVQRDKLLAAAKAHGDFAAVAGEWAAEGTYVQGDRNGDLRFSVVEPAAGDARVMLKLNIEQTLSPLKQTDPREQSEPIGSGGLMMALYHFHRLLTVGPSGFEGEFAHAGTEPFYPPPADGVAPKSLAALRVDCDVLRTRHGPVSAKWYYDRKDHKLLGFEVLLTKDGDPCEVYLGDYKAVDGRQLPHRFEVKYGDKRFGVLTVNKYTLKAG